MKKIITCSVCNQDKPHNGLGMCSSCYKKHWRKVNPAKASDHNKKWREKYPNRTKEYYNLNKDALTKAGKKWRINNKEKIRNKYLKYQYGIDLDTYNTLLKEQQHACKICNASPIKCPVVEHSHKTGVIRGIVCQRCNMAIAAVENNINILDKILKYLET